GFAVPMGERVRAWREIGGAARTACPWGVQEMKFSDLSIRTKLVLGAGLLSLASMGAIITGALALMYQTAGNEAEERARALMGQYSQLAVGQMGNIISATRSLGAAVEGVIATGPIDRELLGRFVTAS